MISFHPSPFTKILVKCPQTTASDLAFYDIFAPQKVTFLKISDDVIACDLWFGLPPNQKSWLRLCQQTYYKLRNRGGYSVLANYQSFLSNLFSLAPPQLFFSINCIRNKLVRVSFIELFDFIIYPHLNKRTNILPLAASQIAHLCHQFNHACTANFSATF